MTRVLVCTVGGSDAPVVHAIEQTKPDFVFFLGSAGESTAASVRTIHEEVVTHRHRHRCPHCQRNFETVTKSGPIAIQIPLPSDAFAIEAIDDPDDLDQVTGACERIAKAIDSRFAEPLQVYANYTGGTKTMGLGLGLFAFVARPRWTLQLNAGGPRDLVQIRAGDVAMHQRADHLRAREAEAQARGLLERFEYESALAVLEAAARQIGPAQAAALHPLRRRCLLLGARDRFDYEAALEFAKEDRSLDKTYSGKLRELSRIRRLVEEDRTPWKPRSLSGRPLVDDLLENALRCADRRRFDDAVGRLYRATELLAQIRLRRLYRISTTNVEIEGRFGEQVEAWLETLPKERGKRRIGLRKAYELLDLLGDPLGRRYRAAERRLLGWIGVRNGSLFAHGLEPIGAAGWRRIGEPWVEWLRTAAEDLETPSGPPAANLPEPRKPGEVSGS